MALVNEKMVNLQCVGVGDTACQPHVRVQSTSYRPGSLADEGQLCVSFSHHVHILGRADCVFTYPVKSPLTGL